MEARKKRLKVTTSKLGGGILVFILKNEINI